MQEIPYISVERTDFITDDRAAAHFQNMEDRESAHRALYEREGSVYVSDLHKRQRVGSVVFTMTFASVDARSIQRMFEAEHQYRDATALLAGRKLLPAHNGAEHGSGLMDGLLEW